MRRGVDFCSHYLRAITSIAKAKKLSCATLFVDVKTAFASVIRELIYHGRMSDGDVLKLFHKFNFNPEIFQQFRAVVGGPSAMEIAQVPENLTKAFASFVGNSYFHTKGVESVVIYESGTGAGNPLADLAFAFLAARVLHETDTRIIADNLHVDIPDTPLSIVSATPLGSGKFTGASYVDDTFLHVLRKVPQRVLRKAVAYALLSLMFFLAMVFSSITFMARLVSCFNFVVRMHLVLLNLLKVLHHTFLFPVLP